MRRDQRWKAPARLRAIWRPIWTGLTASLLEGVLWPKRALVVSIEKKQTCVAFGTRFLRRIRIKGFKRHVSQEGLYQSPEALASVIGLAIGELRSKRAAVTLAIPRDWIILRIADFPGTVKGSIDSAVSHELDRLTPLSAENVYHDFKVLGEEDGRLIIIIAAARADHLDGYLHALGERGIGVERVTIDSSCLGSLWRYLDGGSDFICVSADKGCYGGALFQGGILTSSFSGNFCDDGHGQTRELANALAPLLDIARAQDLSPPVVLISGNQNLAALEGYLNLPVKIVDEQDLTGLFPADKEGNSEVAAGGIVETLWPRSVPFNLLCRGAHSKSRASVGIALILTFLILATFLPYVFLPLQREEQRLVEIERQIAMRKEEVKKAEVLRKEIKVLSDEIATIEEFKKTKPFALTILKELTTTLPKTVWTTRTRMTETAIEMEGYARSTSEILPKLEQSQYLKKAEYSSPTTRDARMDSARFVIKAVIEGFSMQEPEKPKDGKKK